MSKLRKINDLAFDLVHEVMEPSEQFSYAKQIYDLSDEPELNENQQIVLDWLKNTTRRNEREIMHAISYIHTHVNLPTHYSKNPYKAYYKLTQTEEAEVLQAFSQWFLKQEESK